MDTMTPETIVSTLFSTGAAAAAGLAVVLQPSLPRPDVTPVDHFQEADFAIYDRDFSLQGRDCEIGIEKRGICLSASPLEDSIVPGMILPVKVPATSAEFPIILEGSLKEPNLQTVRFGHRIALFNPITREIVDVMDLDAKSFAEAKNVNHQKAEVTAASARSS
ncbi:MAG TPA: hypothetical protein DEB28_01895 [Hyphomonas sp.]|jgi:hypothetical protein|nr:hypothetical protein [Hyphomonas sp.]MAX84338.1 hypothetical protein [Hyphomonas sp.]HBJ42768.1 hypothetical protein [Hyphomonas sp.]HBN91448.1 hypothetical protein [Hyphomonas sp.]HBT35351.1 hypothetical protein [Hyphomonas sp.]|tara:strand:+ start:2010 stop:2501 length:492 start_codon:yes stop_codon:yes gene_type:complete